MADERKPHRQANPRQPFILEEAIQDMTPYVERQKAIGSAALVMHVLESDQERAREAGENELAAAEGYQFVVQRRKVFANTAAIITGRYVSDGCFSSSPNLIQDDGLSEVDSLAPFYASRIEVVEGGYAAVDDESKRARFIHPILDEVRHELIPDLQPGTA